jgi:hypothetical protein
MQAEAGIRHTDQRRVVGGFEPHRAHRESLELTARDAPLEIRAHVAAAGQQHREVRCGSIGWPQPRDERALRALERLEEQVEIFVERPARRCDNDGDAARPEAQLASQSLPEFV